MIDNTAIDFYGVISMEPTGVATVAEPRQHWIVSGLPIAFMISSMRMVLQRRPLRSVDNSTFP